MADQDDTGAPKAGRKRHRVKRLWANRIGWAIVIFMAPILLATAFFASPIGKRFVADQIAAAAPASGLRIEVGRIEGDIFAEAVLRDVTLKDPKGAFLTIPEVDLDWRPLAWLWSGIDVRELTARRGRLERLPELLPGDPDAPILPDFDIRIDRLALENFKLAQGLAGEEEQQVDFAAKVDIRKGRSLIDANGAFGPEDRFALLLDAEPDGDVFDLSLDYNASREGPIAKLTGLSSAYEARIAGEGTWTNWLGHALVSRMGEEDRAAPAQRVAGFELTNRSGQFGLLGTLTPQVDANSILGRALAGGVALDVRGTLRDSLFDGTLAAVSNTLDLRGTGAINLASNAVDGFEVQTALRDPEWLTPAVRLEGATLSALVDGPFRDLEIEHELSVDALVAGAVLPHHVWRRRAPRASMARPCACRWM